MAFRQREAQLSPLIVRHVKPIGHKPGTYPGLSDRLLISHYENNYGGAMRRSNAIAKHLAALPLDAPGFLRNGLKREELIARNSIVLHEVHFDALGPFVAPPDDLARAIDAAFGAFAAMTAEIAATAKALAGGSGWVVLVDDPRDGRLAIQWGMDHTMSFAGATPIFALDVYEHAYHLDFGADANAYVDAVLGMTDWSAVARRWRREKTPADPHALDVPGALAFQGTWIDARRAPAYEAAKTKLPGAVWRDPLALDRVADGLPTDKPVLVYCVLGFNFSRDTAAALREKGFDARYLDVGSSGWAAMGLPVEPK
jgi:Fe-Mn family superoxide dismutase